jgi:hypothetical protein
MPRTPEVSCADGGPTRPGLFPSPFNPSPSGRGKLFFSFVDPGCHSDVVVPWATYRPSLAGLERRRTGQHAEFFYGSLTEETGAAANLRYTHFTAFGTGHASSQSTRSSKLGPKHSAANDSHPALRDGGDAFGVKLMLGHLDPRMQRLGGILIEHRHGLLPYNRAGIDAGIDIVDGAAGDFDAGIEGLFPGLQARKARE